MGVRVSPFFFFSFLFFFNANCVERRGVFGKGATGISKSREGERIEREEGGGQMVVLRFFLIAKKKNLR